MGIFDGRKTKEQLMSETRVPIDEVQAEVEAREEEDTPGLMSTVFAADKQGIQRKDGVLEVTDSVVYDTKECNLKNPVQMAESRFNALKTMLNQLRTARKNLMIVKLDEDMEEEILEDIMRVTRKLKDFATQVVVIPARKRTAKVDENDPRSAEEISEDEAMKQLTSE